MNLNSATLFTLIMAGMAAMATAEVQPVSQRVAAANAPLGVRTGAFIVTPRVDADAVFDDNIYATSGNTESDVIAKVRPEIVARSNWNRHALNALARLESNHYTDNSDENHVNYAAAVDGRVDVMRDTAIGGGVAYTREHEDRGNPNAIGSGVEPTAIDTLTGKLGAVRELGPANLRVDGEAKNIDYKNGNTRTGALLDNSVRDRNEYALSARAGYKTTDTTEVFVRGTTDSRVYDRKGGATVNRSNHGQELVAGVATDVTGKTKAEAYAGYATRNYVDPSLKDIEEPTFGAKGTWNATDLTTVIASIDRGIEETTLGASSGYVHTDYRVGVEHAVLQNAVAKAGLGYTTNDYQGNAANQRNDDILTADVGGKYYVTRNVAAEAGYTFRDRSSNVVGGDYDRNLFLLRLSGTY